MTIKEKLIADVDIYDLPIMVIIEGDTLDFTSVKNVLYFISQEKYKDLYECKYKSACVQTDLYGENQFMICFGKRD